MDGPEAHPTGLDLILYVQPCVDVGCAAEVGNHRRAFDLPDIPGAVFADVAALVEGHVQVVDAGVFDQLHRFGCVGLTVRGQNVFERFQHGVFLIGAEIGEADAVEAFLFASELHGVQAFLCAAGQAECLFLLLAIKHGKHFVGAFCLIPVGISFVIRPFVEGIRRVSVKNRATKSSAFDRITIAASGAVPSGENKFELPGAGLAEEGDGAAAHEAFLAAVMHDLLIDSVSIFLAVQSHENLADEILLVGCVEFIESLLCDVPVGIDFRTQRIVEGKAHSLALFLSQAFIKLCDQRFGRNRFGVCTENGARSERGSSGEGGRAQEVATGE
jgi:hypothetical protein